MAHSHRPTLKQQNKKFKSRHATKSSTKDKAKGRVARKNPKSIVTTSMTAAQTRLNRQNAAKQIQQKKRQELVAATKLFGGADGAPRVVAVVPLCEDMNARKAVRAIVDSFDGQPEDVPESGLWKTRVDRFKTSVQFIILPYRQLFATLDACKAADYVIFLLSADKEVDSWGELALRSLQAQGLPEVVTVTQSAEPPDPKTRPATLKSLLSFIQYFTPTQSRVHDLNVPSSALNAARSICEGRPNSIKWRDGRSWLVGEQLEWEPSSADSQLTGTLKATGVIRGAPLSANRLVHIPNFGDFQVEKIMSAPMPRTSRSASDVVMEVEPELLNEPTQDDAESLTSRNEPDTMANEQTWPTEEEMRTDGDVRGDGGLPPAKPGTTPKAVRMVPRGTSAYQAAWIIDEEDEDGDDHDDGASLDGSDDEVMKENDDDAKNEDPASGFGGGDATADLEDDEDLVELTNEDMESDARKSTVAFQDLDMDIENDQHASWLAGRAKEKERLLEESNDAAFPDEIDTPQGIPALTRFQRYRGMRAFRTSPWDPYENLPQDYARIFQFEDYERTKRKVRSRALVEGIQPGQRVTVWIKAVPRGVKEKYDEAGNATPFVLFGLWQHEHKTTVLNFTVQRNTEYDGSVRSKDPLIICVGPRRYLTNPVFSQHSRGGGKGANNVHKYERFLRHGNTTVATIYGPTVFGKVPCVILRPNEADTEAPHLVASGTFMNPDTKRIVAKRIVLTGHPFKVHRKTATVRYMFFDPADVLYFKPIQLHTKYGRTGHITESLGTHGYFKAHFDGVITQMDTICMSLYKRIYPRWSQLVGWDGKPVSVGADKIVDQMEE